MQNSLDHTKKGERGEETTKKTASLGFGKIKGEGKVSLYDRVLVQEFLLGSFEHQLFSSREKIFPLIGAELQESLVKIGSVDFLEWLTVRGRFRGHARR